VLILNRLDPAAVGYAATLGPADDLYLLSDAADVTEAQLEECRGAVAHAELVHFDEQDGRALDRRVDELERRAGFHHVVAVSEADLVRAGRVRDRLGLPGQGERSALAFRDKLSMKRLAAGAGIAVPAFRAVAQPSDVADFAAEHGLPVVVKPVMGTGSADTWVLRTGADVEAWVEDSRTSRGAGPAMEVEVFVPGTMYHIDGLVHEGELVACLPSRYVGDCLSFVYGEPQASYTLAPGDPLVEPLLEFTGRLLRALPTPATTAFHAEAFQSGDDLVLCEVASRVPGPLIPEQLQAAYGIDLRSAHIRGQAGVPLELVAPEGLRRPRSLAAELVIPPRRGWAVRSRPSCPLAGVVEFLLGVEPGSVMSDPRDINDWSGAFVLQADTEEEILERIRMTAAWFEEQLERVAVDAVV
jgi:hypothetical protein